jgi:hypothetical protein
MSEKRERIKLDEHTVRCLVDDNYEWETGEPEVGFAFVEEKLSGNDLEKGIEDKEAIIQRTSDGKFFKIEWWESPHRSLFEDISFPFDGYEVFPHVITKTIYK